MPETPIRVSMGGTQEILDDGSDFEQNTISEGARLTVQLDADEYWFHGVQGGRATVVRYLCQHFTTTCTTPEEERRFWEEQPPNVLFRTVGCLWPRSNAFSAEVSVTGTGNDPFGYYGESEWTSYTYVALLVIQVGDRLVVDRRFDANEDADRVYKADGMYNPNMGGLERLSLSPESVRQQLQQKAQQYATWASEQVQQGDAGCLARLMHRGATRKADWEGIEKPP